MIINGEEYEMIESSFINKENDPEMYDSGKRILIILENCQSRYLTYITEKGKFSDIIPVENKSE